MVDDHCVRDKDLYMGIQEGVMALGGSMIIV